MQRHPELRCSLSDHFSVEATLIRRDTGAGKGIGATEMTRPLPLETYDLILAMVDKYSLRERKQRRLKLTNFGLSIVVSIGCFVAVWWSPRNFVSFILILLSTLGFGGGILEGLMGGLFVGSEIRALKEFEHEIRSARRQAEGAQDRIRDACDGEETLNGTSD